MSNKCDDDRPHGGVPSVPAIICGYKGKQKRTPLGEIIERERSAYAVVCDEDDYGLYQ